jgi:hypothetical protein
LATTHAPVHHHNASSSPGGPERGSFIAIVITPAAFRYPPVGYGHEMTIPNEPTPIEPEPAPIDPVPGGPSEPIDFDADEAEVLRVLEDDLPGQPTIS